MWGAYPEYAESETGCTSNSGIDTAEFKDAPVVVLVVFSGALNNRSGWDSDCFAVRFDKAGA